MDKHPATEETKPMKKIFTYFLLFFCVSIGTAQIGGQHSFKSLSLSPSARVSGLGLSLITVGGEDVLLTYENPAVANPKMHKQISFQHNFLPGGVKHGVFAVGYDAAKLGMTFHGGVRFLNYGTIPKTDIFGTQSGNISAGEWALQVGASRPLSERWRMGMNVSLLNAHLDAYTASGLSADVGVFYLDTAKNLSYGLVLKHFGTELSTFNEEPAGKLPVNLSMGLSKRLAHLPLRLTATFNHLEQWDLTYDDPNAKSDIIIIGEAPKTQSKLVSQVDNFFRHLVFSGEFLLGKFEQVRLRIGYNHLIHKELMVKNVRGISGFTGGIGIKIKRFRIDYGYTNYHLGGKASHLAVSSHF